MTNKRMVLNIISSIVPFELTITDCNNSEIRRRTINRNESKICFSTCAYCLNLFARTENQIIRRKICLNNCHCQEYDVPLNFNTFLPTENTNTFTLTDLNYGIPVRDALLRFE